MRTTTGITTPIAAFAPVDNPGEGLGVAVMVTAGGGLGAKSTAVEEELEEAVEVDIVVVAGKSLDCQLIWNIGANSTAVVIVPVSLAVEVPVAKVMVFVPGTVMYWKLVRLSVTAASVTGQ